MLKKIKEKILKKLFGISETERKIIITRIDIARMHMNQGRYTWADDNLKNLRKLIFNKSLKGKTNE